MAIARSLRRFLLVQQMEEEQAQSALKSALAQLRLFENALESTAERERRGRQLFARSAQNEDGVDRIAALEEIAAARRIVSELRKGEAEVRNQVAARRNALLAKRVERKQTEALVAKAEARGVLEAARRVQQSTDDWYLDRFLCRESSGGGSERETDREVDLEF
jgi:flagellar biosynthesis chaperone FliJ